MSGKVRPAVGQLDPLVTRLRIDHGLRIAETLLGLRSIERRQVVRVAFRDSIVAVVVLRRIHVHPGTQQETTRNAARLNWFRASYAGSGHQARLWVAHGFAFEISNACQPRLSECLPLGFRANIASKSRAIQRLLGALAGFRHGFSIHRPLLVRIEP